MPDGKRTGAIRTTVSPIENQSLPALHRFTSTHFD
jgi:hypothetical protein